MASTNDRLSTWKLLFNIYIDPLSSSLEHSRGENEQKEEDKETD
jgi:hypothetical protein